MLSFEAFFLITILRVNYQQFRITPLSLLDKSGRHLKLINVAGGIFPRCCAAKKVGSWCHYCDGNENVKKRQYWFDKQNNNFVRDHAFLYISLPSLHEYDVNSPIFTFDGGRSLPATGKENVKNCNRLCVYKTTTLRVQHAFLYKFAVTARGRRHLIPNYSFQSSGMRRNCRIVVSFAWVCSKRQTANVRLKLTFSQIRK